MAANIDTRNDGQAAAFIVGEKAWWQKEGEQLSDFPTFEEAMHEGGLDFEVSRIPLYAKRPAGPDDHVEMEVPGAFATMRTDRNEILGVVGDRYRVLQNRDAFRVLEPLLDAGVAHLDTGGSLRGGRDVWMMVRFDVDGKGREFMDEQGIMPMGLISNNHSGDRGVILQETPTRVVCANTLAMAHSAAARKIAKAIKVRHTKSVRSRTVEAAQNLFGQVNQRYAIIAEQYEALRAATLTDEMLEKLVLDTVAPRPKREGKSTKRQQTTEARVEEQRILVKKLWLGEGKGLVGDRSAWEAYNATVEALDHSEDTFRTRGDRASALIDGSLAYAKQATLDKLYAFATSA